MVLRNDDYDYGYGYDYVNYKMDSNQFARRDDGQLVVAVVEVDWLVEEECNRNDLKVKGKISN